METIKLTTDQNIALSNFIMAENARLTELCKSEIEENKKDLEECKSRFSRLDEQFVENKKQFVENKNRFNKK